jgi:hypothetical protein
MEREKRNWNTKEEREKVEIRTKRKEGRRKKLKFERYRVERQKNEQVSKFVKVVFWTLSIV